MVLRLEPDPEARAKALVRVGGHALSYRGAELPSELRPLMRDLASALSHLDSRPAPVDQVAEQLRRAVSTLAPEASLGPGDIPEESGLRPPRWPGAVRSGAPTEASIWPFDPELAALEGGLRSALKREPLDARELAQDRAWLEGHGLRVGQVEGDDDVLLAAENERTLEAALDAERQLRAHDDALAVARMGELLGYPRCCREAVAALARRDDASLFQTLLPGFDAPASPLSNWLGPLALISHAPCSLGCEPSVRLAAEVLARLEAEHPGFRQRWLELARRLHVLTPEGVWLLDVEDLAPGSRVRRAHILVPCREPLLVRASLRGATFRGLEQLPELLHQPVLAVADHRAGMR
ncbi:MAG: hypothetical protein GXP55_18965 [Deltaproteobacteria bacterium]|nr:hypothetical protein [Deltaproteobacteria bacterium]